MEEAEEQNTMPKWLPIPKVFWSDLNSRPFTNCVHCEANLIESGRPYVIEKAVKGFKNGVIYSTVFEYAMCIGCIDALRGELSEESRNNIEAFYTERIDFKSRMNHLSTRPPEEWLERCLISKKDIELSAECQLYGLCINDQMIYQEFPYVISGEVLDEVIHLISDKTLDELDRFKNDLTSGPPELRELLEKGGPRVFI